MMTCQIAMILEVWKLEIIFCASVNPSDEPQKKDSTNSWPVGQITRHDVATNVSGRKWER